MEGSDISSVSTDKQPRTGPPTIPSTGTTEVYAVRIRWKGKLETFTIGPEFWCGTGDKIEGKRREMAAQVFRMKGWLGCRIRSPLCGMGDQPFENVLHADFDHIDGNKRNHRLGNLQPACHACNAHKQKLQWKSLPEATSTHTRERAEARAVSEEIDLNIHLYPRYFRWLEENVPCPVSEAIFRATREIWDEKGHGAHQTLRGYLQVLTTGDDAPFWLDNNKQVHRRTRKA